MHSIVVIRRFPEASDRKTGLGVYADKIEKIITDRGCELNTVHMSVSKRNGFLMAIVNGMIRPFFAIANLNDKNKIYHAADELCSMMFPFISGKKVMTVHHVLRKDDNSTFLYSKLWRFVTKVGLKRADKIIAASPQTKEEMMREFGIKEEKIVVAMSHLGEQYKTITPDSEREKLIGCMGEFIPRKNTDSAIRTFRKLLDMPGMSEFKMKICGKGRGYGDMVQMTKDLGIEDKVIFTRDLSEDDIVRFYNSLSLFSNPSRHEGLGLPTLEAQACSSPVVYFKGANIPEEVIRAAVSSSDEDDYVNNMYRLLTDEEFRAKTIKEGREYAERFGKDFPDKLMKVYDEVSEYRA